MDNTEINVDVESGSVTYDVDPEAPANESKEDKFKRLAANRVDKIMGYFESLSKLSSSAYSYTDEQIEKMFDALQAKLDESRSKFDKNKTSTKKHFSFDD